MKRNSVAVFCASSFGNNDIYKTETYNLGKKIAESGLDLVFGGGHVGLMGTIAASALENGAAVTGVLPDRIAGMLEPTQGIELIRVETMHQRKQKMYELSDAFIALPGGIGTIEEIFEVCTWNQLGYFSKPVCFYNINSFYSGLENFLEQMIKDGFYKKEHFDQLLFSDSLDKILEHVLFSVPEYIKKI